MVFGVIPKVQKAVANSNLPVKVKNILCHPAGPLTIHFWAGITKWGLVLANVNEFRKPVNLVNSKQQLMLGITGMLWTRWCFVITPVNVNLALCNAFVSGGGWYQLHRKWKAGQLFDQYLY